MEDGPPIQRRVTRALLDVAVQQCADAVAEYVQGERERGFEVEGEIGLVDSLILGLERAIRISGQPYEDLVKGGHDGPLIADVLAVRRLDDGSLGAQGLAEAYAEACRSRRREDVRRARRRKGGAVLVESDHAWPALYLWGSQLVMASPS